MRFITLLAVIATVANALRDPLALESYSFEAFVQDFKLDYTAKEMEVRRPVFEKELARVREFNKKNLGWTETVNKFSAMTAAEKKGLLGHNKRIFRQHKGLLKNAKTLPADFVMKSVSQLPKSVDWRDAGIATSVKDQGHCGSCWAFCTTAVIESHVAKASGLLFDLSVQQMAMCTPNPNQCGGSGGCNGATAEIAMEYVTESTGLLQEFQYGYTSYYGVESTCSLPSSKPVATIDGYVQLPANNYTALMNAVAEVGPVAIALDASTWHAYNGGIFNGCNQENPDVDHGVVLMGYGEEKGQKYWLVRNSWSPSWGEKGYIKLARFDDEDERCGMDITPQDGTACAGDDQPVKACGTCAILFDGAYPLNAKAL